MVAEVNASSFLKTKTMCCFTPLLHAKNLEKIIGNKIFLKWEGNNITHTHKDRAAIYHIQEAVRNGYRNIAVATCGNFGVSLAYFSQFFDLSLTVFIPKRYTNSRVKEILQYGAKIIYVNGSYEDAIIKCNEYTSEREIYNANPGLNSLPSIQGYKEISFEIVKQLGKTPYIVVVPVGNGTTLTGIYQGFLDMYREGMISFIPKMIGTTTILGNQVFESWRRGRNSLIKLSPNQIKETEYNEPLVSYISFDGESALRAIRESKGYLYGFTDEDMIYASKLIKYFEGATALPASASTLLGALRFIEDNSDRHGEIVLIITGGDETWRTL